MLIGSISLGQAFKINTFDAYDVEIGGGDESALMEVADKDRTLNEDMRKSYEKAKLPMICLKRAHFIHTSLVENLQIKV